MSENNDFGSRIRENPFATASLACGLASFLVATLVLGILAVCCATVAMQRATAAHTSKGLAFIGYGLGITSLVLYMLFSTVLNFG